MHIDRICELIRVPSALPPVAFNVCCAFALFGALGCYASSYERSCSHSRTAELSAVEIEFPQSPDAAEPAEMIQARDIAVTRKPRSVRSTQLANQRLASDFANPNSVRGIVVDSKAPLSNNAIANTQDSPIQNPSASRSTMTTTHTLVQHVTEEAEDNSSAEATEADANDKDSKDAKDLKDAKESNAQHPYVFTDGVVGGQFGSSNILAASAGETRPRGNIKPYKIEVIKLIKNANLRAGFGPDDNSEMRLTIRISKSGDLLSADILGGTGNATADSEVLAVLRTIHFPPLPDWFTGPALTFDLSLLNNQF